MATKIVQPLGNAHLLERLHGYKHAITKTSIKGLTDDPGTGRTVRTFRFYLPHWYVEVASQDHSPRLFL